ncbi:PIG-L deacetylase family protein [Sulfoacidibacillus thermotolerans]|uniref:PIG-L domain-containing protein n=1 Tax=Sulfoacidibacillus thermotolerans TaxID=1765684 RepID=A0A2U3DAQ8_SULT2|nr:PIG-L deacetylase family protein [Sulfoacidibacillus thermotolerans]PWI58366.1 hypothetical protein BM613_03875 [Sulfoacidibacillus thermotolerans]
MFQGKRVMVCTAHPDDEIFCSGTIAKMVNNGNEVLLVVGTEGEKGSHDPTATPEGIAALRRTELETAAARLGVSSVIRLHYHDGELQYAADLKEVLFRIVRTHRPDVVLTFDPWKRYELHSDHRTIGFAMIEAAHLGANCWYYHEQMKDPGVACHKSRELYLFNCDEPNYYVDISDVWEQKLHAASAHCSQFGDKKLTENDVRRLTNRLNPNDQITIEPMHKMWQSDLYL